MTYSEYIEALAQLRLTLGEQLNTTRTQQHEERIALRARHQEILQEARAARRSKLEQYRAEHPLNFSDVPYTVRRELELAQLDHDLTIQITDLELAQAKELAEQKLAHHRILTALETEMERRRAELRARLEEGDRQRREQQAQEERERRQRYEASSHHTTTRTVDDPAALKSAFRRFLVQYHPDRHQGRPYLDRLTELNQLVNSRYGRKVLTLQNLEDASRMAEMIITA